jgi:hypothetical protein
VRQEQVELREQQAPQAPQEHPGDQELVGPAEAAEVVAVPEAAVPAGLREPLVLPVLLERLYGTRLPIQTIPSPGPRLP